MTDDTTATAYHEAGHAVAHWLFGFPIDRATITPSVDYAGAVSGPVVHIQFAEESDDSQEAEKKLRQAAVVHLAGAEAQRYYDARTLRPWHSEEDRENAAEALWHLGYAPGHLELIYKELVDETAQLVREHWQRIQTIAAALLEHRELTGADVYGLLGVSPAMHMP
jgi:hypothetical protein